MKLPISACMILRDEQEFLKESLQSFASWVEEIWIADSGSIDGTLEILQSLKGSMPHLHWIARDWTDDFSAARNEIAKFAKQPWILFVDGDEVLEESTREKMERLIGVPEAWAYSIVQRNYSREARLEQSQKYLGDSLPGLPVTEPLYFVDNKMDRIYKNDPRIFWQGRVHESLIPSLEKHGQSARDCEILFHHYGRLKKSVDRREKLAYYLSLTEKKCQDDPSNPAVWIEWMINLSELDEPKKAYAVAEQALRHFPDEKFILFRAFQIALRADKFADAERILTTYLRLDPSDSYARSQMSTALLYQGKWTEAESLATELLKTEPENFIAHLNLSILFFERGDFANAKHHLERANAIRPNDTFVEQALTRARQQLQTKPV